MTIKLLIICYIIFIFYLLIKQINKKKKLDCFLNNLEHFADLNKNVDMISIINFISMHNDFSPIRDLNVENLIITGKLTVNNGSEFKNNGDGHYFQDEENAGFLKIGNVNNNTGISSTSGKQLIVASGSKNIKIFNVLNSSANIAIPPKPQDVAKYGKLAAKLKPLL